ncbi:hypothetical protein C0J52_05275 [Blattella germanica]|nr:hypothetical protein C0J52_05275 [Blattella germanica]
MEISESSADVSSPGSLRERKKRETVRDPQPILRSQTSVGKNELESPIPDVNEISKVGARSFISGVYTVVIFRRLDVICMHLYPSFTELKEMQETTGSAEAPGRQQLCDEEDDRSGYAGYRASHSEREPAEIRASGWAPTRILYAYGVVNFHLYSAPDSDGGAAPVAQLDEGLSPPSARVQELSDCHQLHQSTFAWTQVVSGILMIVLGAMDINDPSKQLLAAKLNHTALGFIMGSMVSDVVKMSFGLDAGPRRNGTAVEIATTTACQGVIYVMLGSTLNINKDKHQPKANIWNNTVLAMGIITTVVNIVISAFDMRDTDKMMIFNTTSTTTSSPK